MKRFLSVFSLTLLLALMLTGCLKVDMSVKLNSDETGSISALFAISEEAYGYLQELSPGSEPFNGQETFEIEEDGVTYIAVKESKKDMTFDEIAKLLTEGGGIEDESTMGDSDPMFDSVKITKSGDFLCKKYSFVATTIAVEQEANEPIMDDDFEGLDDDLANISNSIADNLSKFTLTIEMPGDITDYSGGTVNENKVVFSIMDFSEAKTLSVHSQEGLNISRTYIYIGFCAILFILVIIFVIRRLRVNKSY